MPGLCGILSTVDELQLRQAIEQMGDRMLHHDWYGTEYVVRPEQGIALGHVHLGYRPREKTLSPPEARDVLLIDGEIIRSPIADSTQTPLAEKVLQAHLETREAFWRESHGKFNVVSWEPATETLSIINDPYGMKPLYYIEEGDLFAFASELKSLQAIDAVGLAIDPVGVIQFFTFGHLWGTHTFRESVKVLPPGAMLTYSRSEGVVRISRYHSLPAPDPGDSSEDALQLVDEAFSESVKNSTTETEHLGLALSGGMDTRTLFALMDEGDCASLQTLCMGMKGSRDQVSARKMAHCKGSLYQDFVLDNQFLKNFRFHLDRMVQLTDGHYLSQCIVMPTFPKYRELGIQTLLRGHAGELMHMNKAYNFSLDQAALNLQTETELEGWLFQHLRAYMLESLDQPLLAFADQAECDQVARDTIHTSLQESQSWGRPTDRIWQVFITERLRRETAMSLAKFGSVVETRLPYLDPGVLSALSRLPAESKLDESIQAEMLRKHYPSFLGITNVNTGARVDAGTLTKKIQSLKMRVFAKLGFPGYQPYERLGLWLRRELAPMVREILLSDQCLDRGIFNPETVRTTVDQHLSGRRNHTFLLMAMMIYERGQQLIFNPQENMATQATEQVTL
ncbi:MAG: hypothetical protein HUJ26_06340 [Planctomycetaceae bacterium]|nr:hypothetical protein [Planctomycetaceae bacterium]